MSAPKDPQHYEEWKRELAEIRRQNWADPAYRAKMSAARKGRKAPNKGVPMSDEAKAKLSASLKGKPAPNKGVPMSEEQKAKMSAARKGKPNPKNSRPMSEETKAKLSAVRKGRPAPNKGVPMSEEQKAKVSASKKGKPRSAEASAKTAVSHRGKKHTPETRARIGAAHKGKIVSAEVRARQSALLKGKKPGRRLGIPHSPEEVKRMSERGRQQWENMTEEQKAAKAELLREYTKDITRSALEEVIAAELDAQGLEYERQKRIGWYSVDFYIPVQNCIIEAQGCFWHACEQCGEELHKEKRLADAKRHEYLLRKGYTVKTIWEHERKSELRLFRRMREAENSDKE